MACSVEGVSKAAIVECQFLTLNSRRIATITNPIEVNQGEHRFMYNV